MLPRLGPLPSGSGWSFELKWDGFRALVSTEGEFCVRSRRGWNMTPVLPELRARPPGLMLDGELVAWRKSEPYFPLVCRRVLNRDMSIPLTFVVFDLLWQDGVDLALQPTAIAGTSSSASVSTARPGRPRRRSTRDVLSTPRCASSASRASSPRTSRALPPERSRLGEGQESELLAPRWRDRSNAASAKRRSGNHDPDLTGGPPRQAADGVPSQPNLVVLNALDLGATTGLGALLT